MADIDPVVDLVRQAIGTGIMMALDDPTGLRERLTAALSATGPNVSFTDALTDDAEGFVKMRFDLVGAVECTLCPHGNDYDHNAERR